MKKSFAEAHVPPLFVPELLDKMEHYRDLIQSQPLDDGETREDAYARGGRYFETHIYGGGYTPEQIALANHIVFAEFDEEFYGHSEDLPDAR